MFVDNFKAWLNERKHFCEVCGCRLIINKGKVYRITELIEVVNIFTSITKTYDAVDCPNCGCQYKLAQRLPELSKPLELSENEDEGGVILMKRCTTTTYR